MVSAGLKQCFCKLAEERLLTGVSKRIDPGACQTSAIRFKHAGVGKQQNDSGQHFSIIVTPGLFPDW
jgi:hypothetical protein